MNKRKGIQVIIISLVLLGAVAITIGQTIGFREFAAVFTGKAIPAELNEDAEQYTGIATDDDPWKEVEKIVKAYYGDQAVHYEGVMKLIDDNNDQEKILEERRFDYTVVGSEYYYKLGEIEVAGKDAYTIVVNHDNKTVGIVPASSRSKGGQAAFGIDVFKKLMEERKAKAAVSLLDSVKVLTIDNIEDPTIQGYHIYYDPRAYAVKKLLIGMVRIEPLEQSVNETGDNNNEDKAADTEEPEIPVYSYYLEVKYSTVKKLQLSKKDFRPEQRFILSKEDGIELMPAYKEYKIISGLPVEQLKPEE